jgi:hypothetical protein
MKSLHIDYVAIRSDVTKNWIVNIQRTFQPTTRVMLLELLQFHFGRECKREIISNEKDCH